ncbi:MAG: hypothetical protein Q8P24_18145 [Desulfobacterales bacterium]|nr:hypothetical protein [Desulfobacterales bacterium]
MKSLRDDLENDYFRDLTSEIEAELTADYMGQAERLLIEGTAGQFDHVPAAVLAGAVLEKTLKSICENLNPPEPIVTDKGAPLKLNVLIDTLKKRKVYNELMAKQLRAWAAIRNSAAHGNFEEFNRSQVELMLSGINSFLGQYI